MQHAMRLLLAVAALAALWCPFIALSHAEAFSQTLTVDGVVVYYGLLPAEIVRGHREHSPEGELHGGVPSGNHVYHLVVALFDRQSGTRITNADVSALIEEPHQATALTKLESMIISGEISYGNYFNLPGTGPYRILIKARLPGRQRSIDAIFEVPHART